MRNTLRLTAMLCLAGLAGGCLPLALAGLGGGKGGGTTQATPGGMPSGPGFQHSLPTDRSVGDALAVSRQEIAESCRAQLPEATEQTYGCSVRPICLPGATAPAMMHVCVRPPAGETTGVEAQATGESATGK